MRFVIYGAGAIGGVIGARLFEHGHEVALIARGEHGRAIRSEGLRIESADAAATLRIPAFESPSEAGIEQGDVVVLAMKSQDTADALRALGPSAPPDVPIVCAQNGVTNERTALRRFANVYGVCVMLPATFLEPGVVQANSTPVTGLLDVGRYPAGVDDTTRQITEVLAASSFSSIAVTDVMRWKYTKLLRNLGNAAEALCGDSPEVDEIEARARAEAETILRTAGIEFASEEEDRERRGDLMRLRAIDGRPRGGGSSWQSLARGTGSIEADHLNGEIVLLGRLHGVATPVNEVLQRLANEAAEARRPAGAMPVEELLRLLPDQGLWKL
jgi:2-dehydropantoate 2-reductase